MAEGGNATIDFRIHQPFKESNSTNCRKRSEKSTSPFKKTEPQQLNQNLEIRLHIIEEIKGLINVEGDINSAYKTFKNLQERWRNTGQIPSSVKTITPGTITATM